MSELDIFLDEFREALRNLARLHGSTKPNMDVVLTGIVLAMSEAREAAYRRRSDRDNDGL